MKTLIINGSPHKDGNTAFMAERAIKYLKGEKMHVYTYFDDISPCIDCGYCQRMCGCSIGDKMIDVYNYMISCDNIIFASPLYFSQYTGSFLSVMSRLQMFAVQKYILKSPIKIKEKRGLVLLNGGGSSKNLEGADQTTRILLRELNCTDYRTVKYIETDNKPVWESDEAIKLIDEGASLLMGH